MREVAGKLESRHGVGRIGLAALVMGLSLAACSDPGGETDPSPVPTTSGPSFFIADQFTASQQAVRAVVDAGTIWLLDANGDFVFDADPVTNWNAEKGLALTWRRIPGAVKYHVMARNMATAPTTWGELLVVTAPDANLNPTVVATVNPWTAGLGTGSFPWSFGNHIQFAVKSEDAQETVSDASEPLDVADDFPGVLTTIAIDGYTLPIPFDPRTERGATFDKTVQLGFSEPMSTTAPPTLTSQSANVTIRNVNATAWGDGVTPSLTPLSAATHAFLNLTLTVKGACSELLVPRSAGDLILLVRDTSFFTAGASHRLVFLDGSTGAFLGEAIGVAATDARSGRLTLAAGLVPELPSEARALVCALSGSGATVTQFVSSTESRVTVEDATPFFVGEQMVIYKPQTSGAGQICDLRTVTGLDTVAKVLLLSAPPADGHDATSVVLPLNGLGGEVALRPSATLVLQRDASGGADTELFVADAADVMVGDTVLVDADGELRTTPDQAQATVKQVKFAPAGGTPSYSIVLDLPPSLTLLHGMSRVIGMGDSFLVGGTRDTSAAAVTPLDPHRDQFSADGLLY